MEKLSRRDFHRLVAAAAALGLIERAEATSLLPGRTERLSWRAHRNAGAEGAWKLVDVAGEIPSDLCGTLYRIAPGQTVNHGVRLRHLFDGDAFACGYSFREGRVILRTRYLASPKREEELREGRMLYDEFGTLAPRPDGRKSGRGHKNPASVNLFPWNGRLLALSEGELPIAVDPLAFDYLGPTDFDGSLRGNIGFTAHPKVDPKSGDAYAFGMVQGPGVPLLAMRLPRTGGAQRIAAVPQSDYHMVHDMLLLPEHLVFAVPPVFFDLAQVMSGSVTLADALRYAGDRPLRWLIVRKDGAGEPVVVDAPANMVFHHGNGTVHADGRMVVYSCCYPDGAILELLGKWADSDLEPVPGASASLVRTVLDPERKQVAGRDVLAEDVEFPRFDERRTAADARYLYSLGSHLDGDPFANNRLRCDDLHGDSTRSLDAAPGEVFGEPVFVADPGADAEDRGHVLHLGYDGARDETFLDVRRAVSLERVARVWTGTHLPLGFHGNFVADQFVRDPD